MKGDWLACQTTDIRQKDLVMSSKPKNYRVSFIPIQTLEYEYVVEANDEDGAYYAAKELLQEDIGWDAAKDFNLHNLDEE